MKKTLSLALALALVLALGASATHQSDIQLAATARRVVETTAAAPGDWAVLALARSGASVPAGYYESYYATLERQVVEKAGVLHSRKYTEYARATLALTALGKDPRAVAGYDLTLPLGDYEKTVWQGVNGAIWALIALDSGNYPVSQNPAAQTQATRGGYLDYLLERRLPDGGWALAGEAQSDPDITGMALQALAPYRGKAAVAEAIEGALTCMAARQEPGGGFAGWSGSAAESCAQMLVALCALDIPLTDPRFVKEGNTLLDGLLAFATATGGFAHTKGGGEDAMATEQGLYALAAVQRATTGQSPLYTMTRHSDVQASTQTGEITFPDLTDHPARQAAYALAQRGILKGKAGGYFAPDDPMTRAEFSTVALGALGLSGQPTTAFSDVGAGEWYAAAVGGAQTYGLVQGAAGRFLPLATITRQEAAVMLQNAARLCGLNTAWGAETAVLARFSDGDAVASWAAPALSYCYQSGIFPQSEAALTPQAPILRGELAQSFHRLMALAGLL